MSALQKLLERVEAATGRDRELDADLWWILCHYDAQRLFNTGALGMPRDYPATLPIPPGLGRAAVHAYAPRLTASLDAALALVERVLPGWWLQHLGHDLGGWGVRLERQGLSIPVNNRLARGATPALALCAALLKAMIAQAQDPGLAAGSGTTDPVRAPGRPSNTPSNPETGAETNG